MAPWRWWALAAIVTGVIFLLLARAPLPKAALGVLSFLLALLAIAEWRRARYDLKALADDEEKRINRMVNADEAVCGRCGEAFPARIPVCPRCGAPQGSLV
jgi:membrane protein implicated in regulation of membrane protease activity